jgi:preprotein translocase SecE subunit
VARDRKRAKQRQQRRVRQGAGARGSEPFRRDTPGALEHASGDVDEFDAALVRGARGEPAEAEEPAARDGDAELEPQDTLDEAQAAADEPQDPLDESSLAGVGADQDPGEVAALAARTGLDADQDALPSRRSRAPVAASRPRAGGRAVAFLRASWAELQRVQWPDRRQVAQATAVVLGFVAIAGAYLGLADYVAQKIVNAIL